MNKVAWLIIRFDVLTGLIGTLVLTFLWHIFGLADPYTKVSYIYSHYFWSCLSFIFAAAYFALSLALGWLKESLYNSCYPQGLVQRALLIALGMILPLPITFFIEVSLDPTSHNLIPFEILLYWLPAFNLALAGAYIGGIIKQRQAGMRNER
jgi:hypothetical protein